MCWPTTQQPMAAPSTTPGLLQPGLLYCLHGCFARAMVCYVPWEVLACCHPAGTPRARTHSHTTPSHTHQSSSAAYRYVLCIVMHTFVCVLHMPWYATHLGRCWPAVSQVRTSPCTHSHAHICQPSSAAYRCVGCIILSHLCVVYA